MTQFAQDVHEGLTSVPKKLSSKYFYDAAGDELFRKIMNLPEYYLTRSEAEIFKNQSEKIIQKLDVKTNTPFEVIELGAGDGAKTIQLLSVMDSAQYQFEYIPLDISGNVLEILKEKINHVLPAVNVHPVQGDYFESLKKLKQNHHPKIILFLGSSIGNMSDNVAATFIKDLSERLNTGDKLLLGVDLIKPVEIILPAYNDKKGVTKEFNLNLLSRINRELDGNFDVDSFSHHAEYTEEEGIAKSFLCSSKDQMVHIAANGASYSFTEGEKIHTEISRKYNDAIVNKIIENTGLEIVEKFMDEKKYFADYLLEKK